MSRSLKACLNGPRDPSEHPALPVTPGAIAAEAAAAVAAGADALHIHAKDSSGRDTLEAGTVAAALEAVRAAVPGVAVGLTTGAWAAPGPGERIALVRAWTVLPDFASVNWHEPGSADLAEALLSRTHTRKMLVNPGKHALRTLLTCGYTHSRARSAGHPCEHPPELSDLARRVLGAEA